MNQVMTEKGTEELVKLLRADLVTIENNLTAERTYLDTLKVIGTVKKSTDLSAGTIFAKVVCADYARLDVVCDVYDYANKVWHKGTLTDLTLGIRDFQGSFNANFVGDIQSDYTVTAAFNGLEFSVPLYIKTDKLVRISEGKYTWHWHIDTYTPGYRIIQTPNNIIEGEIVSVEAWEVII